VIVRQQIRRWDGRPNCGRTPCAVRDREVKYRMDERTSKHAVADSEVMFKASKPRHPWEGTDARIGDAFDMALTALFRRNLFARQNDTPFVSPRLA
jgi:hypothetical protein